MLDLQQMARTIGHLQTAAAGPVPADAGQAGPPVHEPTDIAALMLALKAEERAQSAPNLIETGLGLLGALLKRRF
jgi:hypothetical protein